MRRLWIGVIGILAGLLTGCEPERVVIESGPAGYAGRHVGYAWQGEARDASFEDASAFVECLLELDDDATIVGARFLYFEKRDGYWTTRQSGNAYVAVDYAVQPTVATLGSAYQSGRSMFTVYTASPMSFWAAGVNVDGVVAVRLAEPLTRYWFEMRLDGDFDFDRPMRDLTVGSGLVVPTARSSTGAWLQPGSWDELADQHLFAFHDYSHVLSDVGVYAGIDGESTVREFLSRMGVAFTEGHPVEMAVRYGYFGLGGWVGNYAALAEYVKGRNARELTSLVDWSAQRYAGSIDARNRFGVDVVTGATRTAQNSVDGISGATVRVSRESTAFQRALVQAGILTASEVVIGRF